MVFEPTFESISNQADQLPDLAGENPIDEPLESDMSADTDDDSTDAAEEGTIEADLIGADVPFEELPPLGA